MLNYRDKWKELGAPPTVLKIISGCHIPFVSNPILRADWKTSKFVTESSPEMSIRISSLLEEGVLEYPEHQGPSFVSRMFLVKKKDGGVKEILDLRGLNQFVAKKEFHLISHFKVPDFLQEGDWMVRLDMSKAYFHIPIAKCHRRFLRILYEGALLQLTSLPFGLSAAPFIFETVSNWIAEVLRSRGMRVIVYLDDFLLASQNRETLKSQIQTAINLLEGLGWMINKKKSILEPCKSLEFSGIPGKTA